MNTRTTNPAPAMSIPVRSFSASVRPAAPSVSARAACLGTATPSWASTAPPTSWGPRLTVAVGASTPPAAPSATPCFSPCSRPTPNCHETPSTTHVASHPVRIHRPPHLAGDAGPRAFAHEHPGPSAFARRRIAPGLGPDRLLPPPADVRAAVLPRLALRPPLALGHKTQSRETQVAAF